VHRGVRHAKEIESPYNAPKPVLKVYNNIFIVYHRRVGSQRCVWNRICYVGWRYQNLSMDQFMLCGRKENWPFLAPLSSHRRHLKRLEGRGLQSTRRLAIIIRNRTNKNLQADGRCNLPYSNYNLSFSLLRLHEERNKKRISSIKGG